MEWGSIKVGMLETMVCSQPRKVKLAQLNDDIKHYNDNFVIFNVSFQQIHSIIAHNK